jgi:ABC-type branched-subunit amino acid transport system permease subunit
MPLVSHYNGPLWRAPNSPYYSLAWRPLPIHYNDSNIGPHTAITIALLGDLYLAIIMERFAGKLTTLIILFLVGLHIATIMGRYGGPKTAQNVALLLGLYLAIIMYRYGRPQTALNIALLCRALTGHYNVPF